MSTYEDLPYGSPNLLFVEALLEQFHEDPESVDPSWRAYFQAMNASPDVVHMEDDNEQTGTYDLHVTADPHPIIHRASDHRHSLPRHVRDFFDRTPLFQHLSREEVEAISQITVESHRKAGTYISRQGQIGNDLLFIVSGQVAIYKGDVEITYLCAGEMVGELAVFDDRPRSADLVCKTDCELLEIKRERLLDLLRENKELTLDLLRSLAARLRDVGSRQEQVDRMVRNFRERGHVMADLDPLKIRQEKHPELSLEHYGFKTEDLDTKFTVRLGSETSGRSLGNIYSTLQAIYCRSIGAQYTHIDDLEIQEWLRLRLEQSEGNITLSRDEQVRILKKLTDAKVFEEFLHKKFVGAKRFSLEGGESLIPLLDYAIEEAGRHEIDEVIIAMAHRGRLNVLVNIMDKPASQVFREFMDLDPQLHKGSKGDVKYHLGYGCNHKTECGHEVHLSLCFNPSHLEFVGPVALGRTRAKQTNFKDVERRKAMPLIIHGDAAFIGQGVIQEMLNLSELPGYTTGGTVHVVLNNQIGFTTDPAESRSTQYSTDVARMLQIPIFHVNGEHPEAVAHVIKLAMEFRQAFKKDVVIDLYCYRRYGHNEGDDPSFTQPMLYAAIKKRKTIRQAYVENLTRLEDHISIEEADAISQSSKDELEREYEKSKDPQYQYQHINAGKGLWQPFRGGNEDLHTVTSVPKETLISLLNSLSTTPEGFTPHPKIERFLETQLQMARGEQPLSWGNGEALAFASLLQQGVPVRLTGQDAQRGTFSHRHAVLHDYTNNRLFCPLETVAAGGATLEIHNSPLSEIAVLGFEYGFSLDFPQGLIIWEAQFGDFCNVAQVIIDQFIASSEEKWKRLSGLCMFLPHGFEGQGPEHSSARLERFLMLSAVHNIQVVNMTTPAQLFHCLRRQVLRPLRKPLVVMSPKSLLRHPEAVSSLDDLAGGSFQMILPDMGDRDPKGIKRILVCSGKLYYELARYRQEQDRQDVAILRMEQYYPLPSEVLEANLKIYPKNTQVIWVQEEPLNMGAWPFLKLRLGSEVKGNGVHPLNRVSRPEAASPATGSAASHQLEQQLLIEEAFSSTFP